MPVYHYRHRDKSVVPFQVADVNYWLSGETIARQAYACLKRQGPLTGIIVLRAR